MTNEEIAREIAMEVLEHENGNGKTCAWWYCAGCGSHYTLCNGTGHKFEHQPCDCDVRAGAAEILAVLQRRSVPAFEGETCEHDVSMTQDCTLCPRFPRSRPSLDVEKASKRLHDALFETCAVCLDAVYGPEQPTLCRSCNPDFEGAEDDPTHLSVIQDELAKIMRGE